MSYPKAYIICATPRSGTTLLCDLLTDTGVAGQPDSFFQLKSRQWWAQRLDVSTRNWADEHTFDKLFLAAVLKKGTSETSIFGMRLMWCDVPSLIKNLNMLFPKPFDESVQFKNIFGSIIFIHLSRKDKISQAVSRIKAEQSGLWHIDDQGNERERLKLGKTPIYNAKVI